MNKFYNERRSIESAKLAALIFWLDSGNEAGSYDWKEWPYATREMLANTGYNTSDFLRLVLQHGGPRRVPRLVAHFYVARFAVLLAQSVIFTIYDSFNSERRVGVRARSDRWSDDKGNGDCECILDNKWF